MARPAARAGAGAGARARALALAVLAASCAPLGPHVVPAGAWTGADPDPACATTTCVTVQFIEAERLEVRLTVPAAAVPAGAATPSLAFGPDAILGADYADRFVREVAAGGEERAWSGRLEPHGPVYSKRWRVSLAFDAATRGFPVVAAALASGTKWHLPGHVFLPEAVLPAPARLTFELPRGEVVLSSLPGELGVIRAPSLYALHSTSYELGFFASMPFEAAGIHGLALSGSASSEELERAARLATDTLRAAAARLGPPAARRLLVVIEHAGDAPRGERVGLGAGALVIVAGPRELEGRASGPDGNVLVHELMHLWWPADLSVVDSWLSEGLTDFLAVDLAAELDGLDAATRARIFARLASVYAARGPGPPLADAGALDVRAYEGGALVGFCADTLLAARGRSLAAELPVLVALDSAHARGGAPVPALPPETFFAFLEERAPGAGAWARAAVARPDPPAFDECLRRTGWAARDEPYRGYALPVLLGALRLGRLVTTPKSAGIRVDRALAGARFRNGDLLLAVDGAPLLGPEDLDYALRDLAPGRGFTVSVLHGDHRVEVTVPMPFVSARAPATHRVIGPALP